MSNYNFPRRVDRCKHDWVDRGDAGYCHKCGYESTVFGAYFWHGKAKPIVKRFYLGEIDHEQVECEMIKIGGYKKWRTEPVPSIAFRLKTWAKEAKQCIKSLMLCVSLYH